MTALTLNFMLLGPPNSGKSSFTLRHLTGEFENVMEKKGKRIDEEV